MITEASNKIIKEVDEVKSEMERKWGVGGLEEAVADTLREKFKRQYDKLFNAIDNKNNEDIQKHGQATIKGWQFLDKEASKLVWAFKLPPNVWQIQHSSGVVMTVYNGEIEKKDKKGVVMSIEELVKFVPANVLEIKKNFRESEVTIIQKLERLDDEIK